MTRVFNFSAGPAMLPQSVLEQAQAEMLDWNGSGMSVMEMSHRGKEYMSIAAQAEADLREIMGIPSNYKVLFLQGGASSQFAMIPQNLLRGKTTADYVDTGDWSAKAIKEAKRYCSVSVVASTKEGNYTSVPAFDTWKCNADAAYLHYTPNETIRGVEFAWVPETGDVPLVADMSSTILSRPLDVSKYGLIYAGAQKNIGPAGLTIVIVREDLIGETVAGTPTMFDYKIHADNESMYNTPPTYAWYLSGLVFQWIKAQGGLAGMAVLNERKAQKLYAAIENSGGFYNSPVDADCRSWMNVPFTLANADLDKPFLAEAGKVGLTTLKGHRSVGGMRASIYNAMPEAGVDALVSFMQDFAQKNG
ncbi:MAG: 3-phosphoserine/phosphohydroxythreonine transaminase [Thiothrix sp.]|uniref:3-phosphoserine/phosphohydroxythreonine transaminase n=1 Tax=Thiothrix sp. TaxID=1032 RepID=UPI00261BF0A2|nr:3-phosphoserine/phosphohydroxythreonine transaminase [Thiothrix sp.]MDD5393867.1 3-phosphoserine/phosphohydroxythreonine transaminase [Thiothrix sp.]